MSAADESFASVVSPQDDDEIYTPQVQPNLVSPSSPSEDIVEAVNVQESSEDLDEKISFTCRTISGSIFPITQISTSCTILDIKNEICEQEGTLKPNQIRLIYKGKPLKNNLLLIKEANIDDKGTVFIIKNLTIDIEDAQKHGVSVEIKRTKATDRNLVRFRVPQGGPGNYVQVTTAGGVQVRAFIPRERNVGELMEFRLNDASRQPQANRNTSRAPLSPMNNIGPPNPGRPASTGAPNPRLMKVVCPPNAGPGDRIEMMVPNYGRMRVTVPNGVSPGDTFYFRVRA
eukprot:snap_masked-scaffold_9-processed-gene-2.58-mRNA-1 protein AED:1.00 eAED:1.00 QI:0/-1/0/0/-1/1/1/0/286